MSKYDHLEYKYILPLRDVVMYPHVVLPLYILKQEPHQPLMRTILDKQNIVVVSQKDATVVYPQAKDLYTSGVMARILQVFTLPDGGLKILLEGISRVSIHDIHIDNHQIAAYIKPLVTKSLNKTVTTNLMRTLANVVNEYHKITDMQVDMLLMLKAVHDPGVYIDLLASILPLPVADKQVILSTLSVIKRAEALFIFLAREMEWLKLNNKIHERVRLQIGNEQKNYFKREKLKAIQQELMDDSEEGRGDNEKLEDAILHLHAPDHIIEKLMAEYGKLELMAPMSQEAAVLRNYLELAVDLPWNHVHKLNVHMDKAYKSLEHNHLGLEEVKERILETVALQIHAKGNTKGPILCLVGPPGVGKTSLGRAVAEALGRPFARISLGGVRDEAEIRGHRRTYIGAMPGRIIKIMRKVKCSNPLILLDEIDKMGMDFRGDPASALLEVLDPEQNKNFNDHYLELDYDLSNVFFMTTANTLKIPAALLDRLEIIRIPGYTDDEKINIASKHIMPKLLKECGMTKGALKIPDDIMRCIVRGYTREAGVRELERKMYKICRQTVKRKLSGEKYVRTVTKNYVIDTLGVAKFYDDLLHKDPSIGLVNGLAWTSVGGEILKIETLIYPGKSQLILTGSLGNVMKESIRAAWSLVKSRALAQNTDISFFQNHDIHVHVPEGATPKDGPSAGMAVAVAMYSVVTGSPIYPDIAMTGEVTLRGNILRIGGLKEKLIAAHRYHMRKVIIPMDNFSDLSEIPSKIRDALTIVGVYHVDEVMEHVFVQNH